MKNIIYFLLYVIVITEIFVVIKERDELLDKAEGIAQKISNETYKQPLDIIIPQDTTLFSIPSKNYSNSKNFIFSSVILIPKGLVSNIERENTIYYIKLDSASQSNPPGFNSSNIISSDDNFNPNMTFFITKDSLTGIGEFHFNATVEDYINKHISKEKVNKSAYYFSAFFVTHRWIDSTEYDSTAQQLILENLLKDKIISTQNNNLNIENTKADSTYFMKFRNHLADTSKKHMFVIRPKIK